MERHLHRRAGHGLLWEGVAGSLVKQAEVVELVDPEDQHAVPQEDILAVELELVMEFEHAQLQAVNEGHHPAPGDHLQRPMGTVLAVVQVHGERRVLALQVQVAPHMLAEPAGQEHRIGVDLHSPIGLQVGLVLQDALPDPNKDFGVQGSVVDATRRTVQGPRQGHGRLLPLEAGGGKLDRLVAKDAVVLAAEDAYLVVKLRFQQLHLISEGQHLRKAEQ
mmetsp:Transcript_77492/g.230851  ORF Transcript_77492/g.230851 Transcript_77492/m.230851 type:complete len:220 (+) Transcript_77492:177-836(+)